MADRFRFLVSLWSYIAEDEVVNRLNSEMLRELYALVDQAKQAGEIDADLPTIWVVAFFDSTLTAGWMLVEAGDATSSNAARYVKQPSFEDAARPVECACSPFLEPAPLFRFTHSPETQIMSPGLNERGPAITGLTKNGDGTDGLDHRRQDTDR